MKAASILILIFLSTMLSAQKRVETLTEVDLEKLKQGKVITKNRRVDNKVIVVAQGIVVGDSRHTFDVLMQCDKHTEFMPNFVACETYYADQDSIYGKTVVDPPMSKKNIDFYLFTRYQYSNSYSKIAWHLNTQKEHPTYIADTFGFWEIKALDSGSLLLSFYSDSDFNFHWSVNWFLEPISRFFIKNGLPDLIRNVRARVESGEKWTMEEKRPPPKILQKQ